MRRLAAQEEMEAERVHHTLSPTSLVHEANLRLVRSSQGRQWDSRGHFFAAAAEAMRRILIDHACDRNRLTRGGLAMASRQLDRDQQATEWYRQAV